MRAFAQELPQANEAQITQDLIALISEAVKANYPAGVLKRFAHPRAVGCVQAEFVVRPDLRPEWRVGLFAQPQTYQGWVRLGNNAGESDAEKNIRGFSLKLLDVPGQNLTEGCTEQDFVLISHPTLVAGNPLDFYKLQKAVIAGRPLRFFLNPFDLHLREMRITLAARQNHTSHLDIPYWSTTPYLFGAGRAVKYTVRPTSTRRSSLPNPLTATYLREALQNHLRHEPATFDFGVQFQTNPVTMPIEDACVEWREAESPFVPLAQIIIPQQELDPEAGEALAFNPWHSLVEHRPLGGINRVRREVYAQLAALRAKRGFS